MDDRTDPALGKEAVRYDRDLYSWAVEQAALLRAGKIAEADALNIAEELDDVVQHSHVDKVLRKNPGLKPHVNEAVAEAYKDARVEAGAETELDMAAFPQKCPYSREAIMERPIDWPPKD